MIRIQRTPNGYSLHGIEATGLPPRQSQILLTMANGMTQKAAAEALGCKQPSIRNATSALLYKLHAKNSAHAVANAFASGNLKIIKTIAVLAVALHTCIAPYTSDDENQQLIRPRSRQTLRIRRRQKSPYATSI